MTRHSDFPISPIFINRWSARAMSGQVASKETLMHLFEAARWAPSSGNTQPWVIVYAMGGTPAFERFAGALVEANRIWAIKAGALLMMCSKTTCISETGETKSLPSHAFDAGAAWMSLALQGSEMGLVVHAMAGFDEVRARAAAQIPDDIAVHCMIAVGQPGDAANLPTHLQARETPSSRHPSSEFTFEGVFGDKS